MLTALGLNAVAESVYRAMLADPRGGVAELVEAVGAPRPEVLDALDLLSELALVRPSAEQEGRLRAVSPDIGMEILMARQQAELAAQQQRVEASRAVAAQLIAEYADLRPAASSPGVEQLIGIDEIRDCLTRLTRDVTTEVMSFAPGGAQPAAQMDASRPLDGQLLGRGVRMRTVYLNSVRNDQPTVEYANWLAGLGGQVRTVPALPTRMIITDRATAVIPVSSDDTSAGAVVLTGQGTLTALCALFESVWSGAQPLGEAAPTDSGGLSPQESTTIALLAQGHTDESIAKRLGVSQRTARRIATDLMERLGARSRFEAGVRCVQRGWLPE
ncbi:LuxR C-terminal-related transcriptional regulator [Streptomyces sp. NBC_00536]|uniref:LuxR C-terminal-related transcriptional regulator n=1 Tax=Streptomyces sp. NBC_00536 TaxID=2975769 RepID=UPI002E8165F4|nr:LuxR C-terminal-related transcriptional regulator [Streptomyces sp. NBC_00536]WUC80503.1 LuxR C-terminal-related transcriptional regulator [Streptomyces sp. NBC_00536]